MPRKKRHRFQTAPIINISALQVDREQAIIHDIVAMQSGVEALGHGMMADTKTLQMMAALGNQKERGIMGLFGHPGVSENAAGLQIQRAKNFRVDGDKLRHDSHLIREASKSPALSPDVLDYLMSMAENYPQEIAESVVVWADVVWTLSDGREIDAEDDHDWPEDIEVDQGGRPTNAVTPLPVLRPHIFYRVDWVNEGALTHDGLFGASLFGNSVSASLKQGWDWVDAMRDQFGISLEDLPRKVARNLFLYMRARGYQGELFMPRGKKHQVLEIGDAGIEALLDELEEAAPVEAEADAPPVQEEDSVLTVLLEKNEQAVEALSTEPEAASVSAEQYQAVLTQLQVLQAEFTQFKEQATQLLTTLSERVDLLQADVAQVNGERVQLFTVPQQPVGQMPIQMRSAPVPPIGIAAPQHFSERPPVAAGQDKAVHPKNQHLVPGVTQERARRGTLS